MSNIRFQNALNGVSQNIPPIWFMRQAGRYHRHYQDLRSRHSFLELCKNPDLAAQTALGPILDFDFDVAILFSDILFPLDALGMGLSFSDQKGPQLEWFLDESSWSKFQPLEKAIEKMSFQKEALLETRRLLSSDKSLVGFVGSPWTLFTYATQGSHRLGMTKAKSLRSLYVPFMKLLLPLLEANIRLQIEGSAEVIMLFDTAAGDCDPEFFQTVLWPDIEYLIRQFPGKLMYYSKNTQADHFDTLEFPTSLVGLGVDHRWDLKKLFRSYPQLAIQGNFDQALLFLESSDFSECLENYFRPFLKLSPNDRNKWICGLGHGILPATPEAHVRGFVQFVRKHFA